MAPCPGFTGLLKLEFTTSMAISHGAVPRVRWIIEFIGNVAIYNLMDSIVSKLKPEHILS